MVYVSTWLLCFNRYVVAMCSVYPGMLPQMLAYSNINIQAQLQFSRDSWLTYDQMFCTAAATSRNTTWRNVDASPIREELPVMLQYSTTASTACP